MLISKKIENTIMNTSPSILISYKFLQWASKYSTDLSGVLKLKFFFLLHLYQPVVVLVWRMFPTLVVLHIHSCFNNFPGNHFVRLSPKLYNHFERSSLQSHVCISKKPIKLLNSKSYLNLLSQNLFHSHHSLNLFFSHLVTKYPYHQ